MVKRGQWHSNTWQEMIKNPKHKKNMVKHLKTWRNMVKHRKKCFYFRFHILATYQLNPNAALHLRSFGVRQSIRGSVVLVSFCFSTWTRLTSALRFFKRSLSMVLFPLLPYLSNMKNAVSRWSCATSQRGDSGKTLKCLSC